MADTLNYYDLLGVSEDASSQEIKSAHREHVRALHPDQHEDRIRGVMDQQLARVNHAAQVLLDPHQREAYDQKLAAGTLSKEECYEPGTERAYYGEDAADEAFDEYVGEHAETGVEEAEAAPAGLYQMLLRPPAYVDALAVSVAYSVPYALIAIAPTWIGGSSISGLEVLFFVIWFILIPAAAFLLGAALAGASGAFRSESLSSVAILFGHLRRGPEGGSMMPAGHRASRMLEHAVAVLRVLWHGPAALFALIVIGVIVPAGFSIVPVMWFAALAWCVGRAYVLWRSGQCRRNHHQSTK